MIWKWYVLFEVIPNESLDSVSVSVKISLNKNTPGQLSLNKFFDPSTPSMRKGRDGGKKKTGKKREKKRKKKRKDG